MQSFNPQHVILTGIARSGTTLICILLNELPNVVALDEPIERAEISQVHPRGFLQFIDNNFNSIQQMIQQTNKAISTQVDGRLDNHYLDRRERNSLRQRAVSVGMIEVNKKLDDNFLLVIKHIVPFTANVDRFMQYYPTYAVVRNPLAILASWNTISAPYREGYIHDFATPHAAGIAQYLEQSKDHLERQVALLSWHFEAYRPLLARNAVIYYEHLIESNGRALQVITPQAATLDTPLANRNQNPLYDCALMIKLGKYLLSSQGAFWDFYGKSSVESLMAQEERYAQPD